jgi:hypothetical protein
MAAVVVMPIRQLYPAARNHEADSLTQTSNILRVEWRAEDQQGG